MTRPEVEYTPEQAQRELLELVVKAGRRCAYDLWHAAYQFPDRINRELYGSRAGMWLGIFNPANGLKDYRHQLHRDIATLEMEIRRLQKLCRDHGIDPENPNGMPF